MTRKEKRDIKNANHRRNEKRRFERKIEKLFEPFSRLAIASSVAVPSLRCVATAAHAISSCNFAGVREVEHQIKYMISE